MNRHGFALLTVLWLIAALGMVVGVSFSVARLGMWQTRNRVLLTRAAWAREACHEILLARYAEDPKIRVIDTIDLGRGTWCRAELENANAKLDLSIMSVEAWRTLLDNDTLVDAVLDWQDVDDVPRTLGAERAWYRARGRRLPRNGPLASPAELRYVRGFSDMQVARLENVLTTRGISQVDLNTASPEVLSALPGMTPEAVAVVHDSRVVGRLPGGIDDLLGRLSPPARQALLDRYQEFSRIVVFESMQFIERIEGGVQGANLKSRGWLTVIPAGTRLAVVRREME